MFPMKDDQNVLGLTAPGQINAAPQMVAPAGMVSMNPYQSYRPDTVLSGEDTQARLGLAVNKLLDDVVSGGSRADRFENVATDIGAKLVFPAMAAFGGDGTSQAGVNLMQQARQQVLDAKALRKQNQAQSLTGAKYITDIVNNTSPGSLKALGSAIKGSQGQQKIDIAAQAEQRKGNQFQARQAETERSHKALETFKAEANRLGWAKLGFDQKKFEATDQRIREMADDRNALIKRAQDIGTNATDQRSQLELGKLQAHIQEINTKLAAHGNEVNQNLALKASEVTIKDGVPYYTHMVDGKPVQLPGVPIDGVEFSFDGVTPYSDDPATAAIMQKYGGAGDASKYPQPQGAQPAAVAQSKAQASIAPPPAALAEFFARLVRNPQQEHERIRQGFMRAFPGFDPMKYVNGAR